MEIHEIDKQKMESLKALADVNIQISKAKNDFIKLQGEEAVYVEKREKKVLANIQSLLADSTQILKDIDSNYEGIKDIHKTASSMCAFIEDNIAGLQKLQKLFIEKTEAWDENVKKTESKLAEVQKQIKVDRSLIESEKQALKSREIELGRQQQKIESDRGELERSITRLKEGRI